MAWWLIGLWSLLVVGTVVALLITLRRANQSGKRMSRSIDPINQKAKGLKLEVSALRRSRLDRQRRLEVSKTKNSGK